MMMVLGWRYLSSAQALDTRGSERAVLLTDVMQNRLTSVEVSSTVGLWVSNFDLIAHFVSIIVLFLPDGTVKSQKN